LVDQLRVVKAPELTLVGEAENCRVGIGWTAGGGALTLDWLLAAVPQLVRMDDDKSRTRGIAILIIRKTQ
jgi:hypothetical protein